MTVSPNLTLLVLVLIKLPSLLSLPAGETLFILLESYSVLRYSQCYLKPVSSKKQLY